MLVQQFRPALAANMLELPGGLIDTGESPDSAVVREVLEETGYSVLATIELGVFAATVGYSDELIHLFVCLTNLASQKRPKVFTDCGPISVTSMSLQDAIRAITESPFADSKTLLGLLLYQAHSAGIWERLQERSHTTNSKD